jgi:Kelch motif protein
MCSAATPARAGRSAPSTYSIRLGASRDARRASRSRRTAPPADLHGRILVFGGASTTVHDAVQRFFPTSGRSQLIGHLPTVRADITAAVVGQRVILIGGFNGAGPQRTVWATRDGRHFKVLARLPQAVRYPAAAALGRAVYVFGGLISGGEYTGRFSNAIQRVSLPSGRARIVGRLPTPLAQGMAAVIGGHIYVLGGSTPAGPTATVRRFDPATGRTVPAGRLAHPRTDAAVATVGHTIYLLGGTSNHPLDTFTAVRFR